MNALHLCLLASLLATLPAGCRKTEEAATESAYEAATGRQVDIEDDGDRVTVETPQGAATMTRGDAARLPASFPRDMFLPDGYKVLSTMDVPGALTVEIAAPGQVAAVTGQAEKAMQAKAWKQVMAQDAEANTLRMYEKANRSAIVTVYDNAGDGVKVGLQVMTKQ